MHRKPRRISDMTQSDLSEMVCSIYEIMFWDRHVGGYNTDKPRGAAEIGAVVNVFAQHKLVPVEETEDED